MIALGKNPLKQYFKKNLLNSVGWVSHVHFVGACNDECVALWEDKILKNYFLEIIKQKKFFRFFILFSIPHFLPEYSTHVCLMTAQ